MTASSMTRESLWSALAALGRRAREPVSIVLGGSAALILGAELRRPTDDGDVVASEPDIGELQSLIRDVAASEGLPPGWLNGSIQAYTYVLPGDFGRRLVALPAIGRLSVSLLGRPDVILMKVYAMRPRDVEDLRSIRPTADELAFVRAQIAKISDKESEKAADMTAFLDEWSG